MTYAISLPVLAAHNDSTTEIPEVSLSIPNASSSTDLSTGQMKYINQKNIQQNSALNLSDFLSKQSTIRVNLNSALNSQYSLSFRGFGDNASANSLILIDGFPLMNSTLLPPEFNAYLLSDIDNIQIFQGSEGSLWGNQAVGGVLNIQTRVPNYPFGKVTLGYGNDGHMFTSGLYSKPWGNNFFTKFSGLINNTHNAREHDRYAQNQFSAEQIYRYKTGTVKLAEKIFDNTQEIPGGLSLQQFEESPNSATDFKDHITSHTQIYQLLHQQILNNRWMLETRLSHSHIQREGFFFSPFAENQYLNWFNPKLIGNFETVQWIMGAVLQNEGYESFRTSGASSIANTNEQDGYGQLKFNLKQWELTLGSRYARQNSQPQIVIGKPLNYSHQVFVTEEGLAYKINQYWKVFLRRDGNFRFPKTNEEVWLADNVTQLKPQTGVSYEAGLDYSSSLQQFQLSVYKLHLKNEIAYDPTQTLAQPFGAAHNFDPTLRKGISVSEEIALIPSMTLNTGIDYVDARFDAGPYTGKAIPAVPAWNVNAGLNIQFLPHWRTGYQESYHGSAYASNDVLNRGKKTFSYWLGDWSVEYFNKNVKLAFKICNVFNQRYAQYTVFNTGTLSNLYYPAPGRIAFLSVSYNIGS